MSLSHLLYRHNRRGAVSRRASARPRLEVLEGREVPAVYGVAPAPIYYGQMGLSPLITYDSATAAQQQSFVPYASSNFRGEVRVAVGDVTNDGTPDTVTVAGPNGGPHVRVFDGVSGALVSEWMAYNPNFYGGCYVASADVNGDGRDDVVTGQGSASHVGNVKVWDLSSGVPVVLSQFPSGFRGDRVAAGDFTGDGKAEVVVATVSGTPAVKVYNLASGSPVVIAQYAGMFSQGGSGTNVAVGDVNGDGQRDLVVSSAIPSSLGGSRVKVFSGLTNTELMNFVPYAGYGNRVTLATTDVDNDGDADIVTGATDNSDTRIFRYDEVSMSLLPPDGLSQGAFRIQQPYGIGPGRGVWVAGDGNL